MNKFISFEELQRLKVIKCI